MQDFQISEGMAVRSSDGEKLGKIVAREADGFVVEKGFFFPKDCFVRADDVVGVSDGEVQLRSTAASLRDASELRGGDAAGAGSMAGSSEEVRVPVAEEELVAERRAREAGQVKVHEAGQVKVHEAGQVKVHEAGQVKVHKDVHTERRHLDVPVTREEVHVERTPASGEARPGDATFQEGTVTVPVREEEVEIRKRPVVREEVRVSKTARREERRADADVRKESVDVERGGDLEKRSTPESGRTGIGEEPED
jgi:uncharacterized protein (TIGR02271 family)